MKHEMTRDNKNPSYYYEGLSLFLWGYQDKKKPKKVRKKEQRGSLLNQVIRKYWICYQIIKYNTKPQGLYVILCDFISKISLFYNREQWRKWKWKKGTFSFDFNFEH